MREQTLDDTVTASELPADAALRLFDESQTFYDPLRFRLWAEMGLTTPQLRVLTLVREHPGLSSGLLARTLGVTPPTITGLIDRLERIGLIRRASDPNDRRLVRHEMTEKGEQLIGHLARDVETYTRAILADMSAEEVDTLVRGMDAFVAASRRVLEAQPDLAVISIPEPWTG